MIINIGEINDIQEEVSKNWDFSESYGKVNDFLRCLGLFLDLYRVWLRRTNNKNACGLSEGLAGAIMEVKF